MNIPLSINRNFFLAFNLILFSMLIWPNPLEARETLEILESARTLMKNADQINLKEPTLYYDQKFAEHQKWTLKYQRFYTGSGGDFRRIFLLQPKDIRFESLVKAYIKYGKIASNLSGEILYKVSEQRLMFTEEKQSREYAIKYNKILSNVLPKNDGTLTDYEQFDCDYVSQPTNALWFSINATLLIDEYGKSIFGEKWETKKSEINMKDNIKNLNDFHRDIDSGIPTVPLSNLNPNIFLKDNLEVKKEGCD